MGGICSKGREKPEPAPTPSPPALTSPVPRHSPGKRRVDRSSSLFITTHALQQVLKGNYFDVPEEFLEPPVRKLSIQVSTGFGENSLLRRIVFRLLPKIRLYARSVGLEVEVCDMRWGMDEHSQSRPEFTECCMRQLQRTSTVSPGYLFLALWDNVDDDDAPAPVPLAPLPYSMYQDPVDVILKELSKEDRDLFHTFYELNQAVTPSEYQHRESNLLSGSAAESLKVKEAHLRGRLVSATLKFSGETYSMLREHLLQTAQEMEARTTLELQIRETRVRPKFVWIRRPKVPSELTKEPTVESQWDRFTCQGGELEIALSSLPDGVRIIDFDNHQSSVDTACADVESAVRQGLDELGKALTSWDDASEGIGVPGRVTADMMVHGLWCRKLAQEFRGREGLVREIVQRLDCAESGDYSPVTVAVAGPRGCGKSALLAKVAEVSRSRLAQKHGENTVILLRFLGLTPPSTGMEEVLWSMYRQWRAIRGDSAEVRRGRNYREAVEAFHAMFNEAGDMGVRLVVILDGLDRMHDVEESRSKLTWLPSFLPPCVSLVVSCLEDDLAAIPLATSVHPAADGNASRKLSSSAQAVRMSVYAQRLTGSVLNRLRQLEVPVIMMEPLSLQDCETLIESVLQETGASLPMTPKQVVLKAVHRFPTPLYTRLCVRMALQDSLHRNAEDIAGVVEQHLRPLDSARQAAVAVVKEICQRHGAMLVLRTLAYIAVSKSGLSLPELADLLNMDEGVLGAVRCAVRPCRVPRVLLASVLDDLEGIVSEVGGLFVWEHEIFRDVPLDLAALETKTKRKKSAELKPAASDAKATTVTAQPPLLTKTLVSGEIEFSRSLATEDSTDEKEDLNVPATDFDDTTRLIHHQLARYFRGDLHTSPSSDRGDGTQDVDRGVPSQPLLFSGSLESKTSLVNEKRCSELAYHLLKAGHIKTSIDEMCSLEHVECRFRCGLAYDLVRDLRAARLIAASTCVPSAYLRRVVEYHRFVSRSMRLLSGAPRQVPSEALNLNGNSSVYHAADKLWVRAISSLHRPNALAPGVGSGLSPRASGATMLSGRSDRRMSLPSSAVGSRRSSRSSSVPDIRRGSVGGSSSRLRLQRSSMHDASAVQNKWLEHRIWSRVLPRPLTDPQLLELTGHTDHVLTVAISEDSRFIAAGAAGGAVRVWNDGGEFLTSLVGHTGDVRFLSFNFKANVLVTASDDDTVRFWSVESGGCMAEVEGTTASFQDGSKLVATGSQEGRVNLWDTSTLVTRCVRVMEGHTDRICNVSFSPIAASHLLASGSDDRSARLWNFQTGECLHELKGHTNRVSSVVFNPNGKLLVTGSWDRSLILWNTETGERMQTVDGGTVSFSPDGKRMVSACWSETSRVWDVSSGKCISLLDGHKAPVNAAQYSPDGLFIATASSDKTVRIWNSMTGKCVGILSGHSRPVNEASFSRDGSTIASVADDMTVRLWDVETALIAGDDDTSQRSRRVSIRQGGGSATGSVSAIRISSPQGVLSQSPASRAGYTEAEYDTSPEVVGTGCVLSVSITQSATTIASGSEDRVVRLWDTVDGRLLSELRGHTRDVSQVAYSPDDRTLASASYDQTVRIWDTRTTKCSRVLSGGHTSWVRGLAWSPDGSRVVSAAEDKSILIWNVQKGSHSPMCGQHDSGVLSVAWAPSGYAIASGSWDSAIVLWDAETQEVKSYFDHGTTLERSGVRSLCFSPDSKILASGGSDATVRLWDERSRSNHISFKDHKSDVTSVMFASEESSVLVSASNDMTVKLWDVRFGRCCATLEGHSGWVVGVSIAADASCVASASFDGTVRVWDVEDGC